MKDSASESVHDKEEGPDSEEETFLVYWSISFGITSLLFFGLNIWNDDFRDIRANAAADHADDTTIKEGNSRAMTSPVESNGDCIIIALDRWSCQIWDGKNIKIEEKWVEGYAGTAFIESWVINDENIHRRNIIFQ